ncbi:MAG: aminotransferase class I/II-fold pyridoxal phosphate-dependent enzyme [Ruminococcus flavefaciens]|nr:aminotransferase class I/II-fold pyridoxal phosphate-dependent enzyme [Ruminococcus flavefaciens]
MIDVHGGNIYKHKGFIDFSANINPLGMPESVRQAVIESADLWEKYPDPYCTELTEKLSVHEKISDFNIVCGNGADDLICRIITAFRPLRALVCCPSFSEYARLLKENGCDVSEYLLKEKNDFAVMPDFVDYIKNDTDIVFLCSPNNPTGKTVCPEVLKKTAEKCLKNNTLLVCDECFMDFAEDSSKKTSRNFLNENMVILKAFTKIYAMAGLRLGYGIFGSMELAGKVRSAGQYWSVSVPAQVAGITALDEKDYIIKTIDYIKKERDFLVGALSRLGFKVFEPEANFIFFKSSLPVDRLLENEKILIRNCANYSGLDGSFFRIAVRTHQENVMLVSALRRIING